LKGMTTRLSSFALLKYFVTMSTSPFEVGTTLLQVQYSPHQDVEVMGIPEPSIQPVQVIHTWNPSHLRSLLNTHEIDTFIHRFYQLRRRRRRRRILLSKTRKSIIRHCSLKDRKPFSECIRRRE
jgi:hypothetical protein